jgi:anti-sigma factor RsiW
MRMSDSACRLVRGHVDEYVEGTLSVDLDDTLRAHCATCAACAGVVARQRRLRQALQGLARAPVADFPPPRLPESGRSRLRPAVAPRPLAWTAAAAAALVMAVWAYEMRAGGGSAGETARVHVESVVRDAGGLPPLDERLLALTAGAEAVAMRRPTEIR